MLVLTEKKGSVTTIILNRPETRNAVDRSTAEALVEAFQAFERDDETRVAVLAGAGGYFCAGADLKAISEGRADRLRGRRRRTHGTLPDVPVQTGDRRRGRVCRSRWSGAGLMV